MADINKTVQIIFAAEDKTSATLNTLQKEGQETFSKIEGSAATSSNNIKSTWDTLKTHWIGITTGIAAAWITVSKAWDLMEEAAQFQEQKAALNNLAGQYNTTADSIIASLVQVSDGLISNQDAVAVAAKGLLVGLNPAQLTKFMEVVKETTNVTGKSVSESFEMLINAAATGRERALKEMGIIVDLGGAYKEYAASIGKSADELTESEKQTAGVNAILGKSSEILKSLGNQADSTADKMEQFTVMMKNLKLGVGEALIIGVAGGVSALMGFSAAFNWAVGVIAYGLEKLFGLASGIPLLGALFEPLESAAKAVAENSFMAAEDAAAKSKLAYDVIFDNADQASSGIKKVTAAQDDGKVSASEYASAVKEYGDAFTLVEGKIVPLVAGTKEAATALKKLDDEIFSAKKENVDDWTALAMEYNKKEVELRTAGVYDLTKVDEWYYIQADALRKKDSDASAKAQEEQKKKTEASIDQMMKFKLGLEEIQSKERISIFEIQTKVDLAAIEAASKAFETMFGSIDAGVESTGDTLVGLFGLMGTASTTPFGMEALLAAIEQEEKLRQKEFDLQTKLIEAQINYMALKAQAMMKGEALINISADGLEPEIEAFMWQILKRIQTRANAEGAEYLLGI